MLFYGCICCFFTRMMNRNLIYLNLILCVGYFLAYLQNSSPAVICGLLSAVLFSWLCLSTAETGNFRWTLLQWISGILCLLFAVYTGYGAVFLLSGAAEYGYFPAEILLPALSGLFFSASLLLEVFFSWLANYRKKTH